MPHGVLLGKSAQCQRNFFACALTAAFFSSVKENSFPRCILSSEMKEAELVWRVPHLSTSLDHRSLSPETSQILQLPATCLSVPFNFPKATQGGTLQALENLAARH